MKIGLIIFDLLSLIVISCLWGISIFLGFLIFQTYLVSVWFPIGLLVSILGGIIVLIFMVGLIHRLLPTLRPGRYEVMKSPMFFFWIFRLILKRALFAPVLKELLFQFTTLRFLALRALGAKIAFSSSMSSDVDILDPWFLEVGPGATIGSGCFLSGHFMDKGDLLLNRISIGSGSLLAARVTVGPATNIGTNCRILFGVTIGVHIQIEDDVTIGAASDIEGYATIVSGVRMGTRTFLHKGVSLERDTKIREEIFVNAKD